MNSFGLQAADASYVLLSSNVQNELTTKVLSALATEGFVLCISTNAHQSQSVLTASGLSCLQVTQVLTNPVELLRVREGVPEPDMTLFELLLLTQRENGCPM